MRSNVFKISFSFGFDAMPSNKQQRSGRTETEAETPVSRKKRKKQSKIQNNATVTTNACALSVAKSDAEAFRRGGKKKEVSSFRLLWAWKHAL
jgi:hypothetical protein